MPADIPAALLWDFDGTLVESEDSWFRAEQRVLGDWGFRGWTREDANALVGNHLAQSTRILMDVAGVAGLDPEHYAGVLAAYALDDIQERGAPFRPGADALLYAAREADIACALVSATFSHVLEAVLATMRPGLFDVVVNQVRARPRHAVLSSTRNRLSCCSVTRLPPMLGRHRYLASLYSSARAAGLAQCQLESTISDN